MVIQIPGWLPQTAHFISEGYNAPEYAREALDRKLSSAVRVGEPWCGTLRYQRGREITMAQYATAPVIEEGELEDTEDCLWAVFWIEGSRLYAFYGPSEEIVTDRDQLSHFVPFGLK